eukprot:3166225-Ditylum_brightwellii.AAC.1
MGQTGGEGLHSGFRDDDFAEAAALAEDVGISPEKVMALQASMRTNEHTRTPNTDNREEEEFFNVMAMFSQAEHAMRRAASTMEGATTAPPRRK